MSFWNNRQCPLAAAYLFIVLGVTNVMADTGTADIHKVLLSQHGLAQFIKYDVDVPPLDQFTLCLWIKSYNLTNLHPLFSYSLEDRENVIRFWISPGGRWVRASVFGREVCASRVDRPERAWRHICLSWHGRKGECHIYVDGALETSNDDHRLKGIILPGGGDILVGQEYTDADKDHGDGIEGEVFGFNMVLSSSIGEISPFEPTVLPNYVILGDIISDGTAGNPVMDFSKEETQSKESLRIKPVKSVNFRTPSKFTDITTENISEFETPPPLDQNEFQLPQTESEIKVDSKPPIPLRFIDSDHMINFGNVLISEPDNEAVKPTYEVLYAQANYKGNKWSSGNTDEPAPFWNIANEAGSRGKFKMGNELNYPSMYKMQTIGTLPDYETPPPPGRNNFYKSSGMTGLDNTLGIGLMIPPKPLYFPRKQRQPQLNDLYPYPSETVYVSTLPSYSRKFKRSTGEKNIQILNPSTLAYLLYPKHNKVINVEILNTGESHNEPENIYAYHDNPDIGIIENRINNHRVTANDTDRMIKTSPSGQRNIASSINKIIRLNEQEINPKEDNKKIRKPGMLNKQRKSILFPQVYYDPDSTEEIQNYREKISDNITPWTFAAKTANRNRNLSRNRLIINNKKFINQPLYKQIAIAFEMAKLKKDQSTENSGNDEADIDFSDPELSSAAEESYDADSSDSGDDMERVNNFGKIVKLGNALGEMAVFKKHGSKVRSFENGDDTVPIIDRYRSDLDNEHPFDIPPSLLENRFREKKVDPQKVRFATSKGIEKVGNGIGLKLIELTFEHCLLGKGSPLQQNDNLLISWSKTPMFLYGGARIKKAFPACGRF